MVQEVKALIERAHSGGLGILVSYPGGEECGGKPLRGMPMAIWPEYPSAEPLIYQTEVPY